MRLIHCIAIITIFSQVIMGLCDEYDYRNILHKPGNFSADNFHFPGPEFTVNTFNGNLNVSHNLIRIRGRNNLDLDITLYYNSKDTRVNGPLSPLRDKGCLGRGWSLQFGRLDPAGKEVTLENGLTFTYGKSREINPKSVSYRNVYVTEEFDKLYQTGYGTHELIKCGGRRIYRFGHAYEGMSLPAGAHLNGIYVTGIYTDRQDSIRIEYIPGSYKINRITDTLGRMVYFTYYTTGMVSGMVRAIQYPGPGGRSLEIRFHYNETGESISSLELPNGRHIRFKYVNEKEELAQIEYSTGGIVSFTYGNQAFLDYGGPQGAPVDQIMAKCIREVKTDYDCNGVFERIRYDYATQDVYPYLYKTTITDQCGHQTLVLHEHINSRNNLRSRAGRVREKYYYEGPAYQGNLLKTELNVWGRYQVVYPQDDIRPLFAAVLYQSAVAFADSGTVTRYYYDGVPNPSGSVYEYRVGYNEDYTVDFTDPRMMSFKNITKTVQHVNAKNIRIDISNRNFDILDVLLFDDSDCRTRTECYAWVASPRDRLHIDNQIQAYYGWRGYRFYLYNYYVNLPGYYEKTASDGPAVYKNYLYDMDLSAARSSEYGYLKTTHDGFLSYVLTQYTEHQPAGIPDTVFMEYDMFGNLIRYKGSYGQVTEWEYGSEYNHAFPTREMNSLYGVNAVAGYDYHTGLLTRYQDANNDVTVYSYDDMNNLARVQSPGDAVQYPTVLINYDYDNRKIIFLSKKTSSVYFDPVVYFFNPYGMLTQTQWKADDQTTTVQDILYNPCNRRYLETDRYARKGVIGSYFLPDTSVDHRTFFYDAFGRLTRTVFPKNTVSANAEVHVSYQGLQELYRDENSHQTRISKNLENRVNRRINYTGSDSIVVKNTFDGFGYPAGVYDPNGQVTRYNYSDVGEMLRRDSPDGGPETYMYINHPSEGHRSVEKVDGQISDHEQYASHLKTYDGLDRLITHGFTSGEIQVQNTLLDGFEHGGNENPCVFVNQDFDCNISLTWNSIRFRISDFAEVYEGEFSAHSASLAPGEQIVLEYRFEPCIDLKDAANLIVYVQENPDQEDLYPISLISTVRDAYMNESVYTPPSGGPLGVWRQTSVFVMPGSNAHVQWDCIKMLRLVFMNPCDAVSYKIWDHDAGEQIEGLYPKNTRDFYLDDVRVSTETKRDTRIAYRATFDEDPDGFRDNLKGHLFREETYTTSTPEPVLNSSVQYEYDDRHRVNKIQMENRGLRKEFILRYDHSDNITEIIYPDGFGVIREYYGNQQLFSVKDKNSGKRIVKMSYNSKGRVKCIYYHDGIYSGYNYDFFTYYPRNWIKMIQFRRYKYVTGDVGVLKLNKEVLPASGTHTSETIWQKYYVYDNTGNILEIRNNSLTGELQSAYHYDELNRLTTEKNYPLKTSIRNWSFDRAGNILTLKIDDGSEPYYRYFRYNSTIRNRLEQSDVQGGMVPYSERQYFDIQYDKLGNMSGYRWYENNEQGACRYTYNLLGQMTEICYDSYTDNTKDVLCKFAYDYHGNKVYSDINGEKTWYFYAANKLMAEYDNDQKLKYYYIYADDRRVARRSASGVYQYYRTDHLGSVRIITDYKGNPLCSYDYYAFGEDRIITGQSTNRLKFTGKEEIPVPAIYYFAARYYDPVLGRWLSPDPLSNKLPAWSPYVYVTDNPLRYFDPDGRYGKDVHYYWTKKYMGELVAEANWGVDLNTPANPFRPKEFNLHFMPRSDAAKLLENAVNAGDKHAFGKALHSFQDSFRHEGYKWPFGHGFQSLGHLITKALNFISFGLIPVSQDPDADLNKDGWEETDTKMQKECLEWRDKFNNTNPDNPIVPGMQYEDDNKGE